VKQHPACGAGDAARTRDILLGRQNGRSAVPHTCKSTPNLYSYNVAARPYASVRLYRHYSPQKALLSSPPLLRYPLFSTPSCLLGGVYHIMSSDNNPVNAPI
jgi:hypothetical protein